MNLSTVIKGMKEVDQISGKQTVLQHGLSVRKHLNKVFKHLQGIKSLDASFVPSWLQEYKEYLLVDLNKKEALRYALWHDLGKPLCAIKGPEG